jgi:hypothetical protein
MGRTVPRRSTLAVSIACVQPGWPAGLPFFAFTDGFPRCRCFSDGLAAFAGYFQAHFADHAASREIAHNPLMRHVRFNHQLGKKLC